MGTPGWKTHFSSSRALPSYETLQALLLHTRPFGISRLASSDSDSDGVGAGAAAGVGADTGPLDA